MLNQPMGKPKKYYPNNWEAIESAPAEFFTAIEYEDFMDWRVLNWDMPDSVVCMIRAENKDTGKIKEYVYQKQHAAENKISKLMKSGSEFVVCTDEQLHYFISPNNELDYDWTVWAA